MRGLEGFGYDPIFFYPPFGKTTAEIPLELKNRVSHRGKALKKLKEILNFV
jgi:XTP/dITP diphosphohydrolase